MLIGIIIKYKLFKISNDIPHPVTNKRGIKKEITGMKNG